MADTGGGVRIAELFAMLSYAADVGLGQPMEHCMRQTVIAMRLGTLVGAGDAEREATYYLGLIENAYCHADAAEQASWFGDDISFKGDGFATLALSTAGTLAFMVRRVGAHGSAASRVRRLAAFPGAGRKLMVDFLTTHSTLGAQFAAQIGADQTVVTALRQAYEQWDGNGHPAHLRGLQISLPARLVALSAAVEVFSRQRGVEAARSMAARNSGAIFDPAIAAAFRDHATDVLADLDAAAGWELVLAAEPRLGRRVNGAELDTVLTAMADLVDLKSPFLAGHSRGVANLAAAAARMSGLDAHHTSTLYRAGLLHDLGRLGVSNAIWDKPRPLAAGERERVRLHPYLTDRMLAQIPALAASRQIAARHHERLDGSGYPHGLTAAALDPLDRLLSAADMYHALTEPRPHRAAYGTDEAAAQMSVEARERRLDADAVNAVLRAAGQRAPTRRDRPAGLTAREVDVLALLARGHANKQIAARVGITPKTVSNHVEHIYAKIGVSSRAAATLYATQQGLLGTYQTGPPRPTSRTGQPAGS